MLKFLDYEFPEFTAKYFSQFDISTPTPIQAQTLPIALGGNDMIGISQVKYFVWKDNIFYSLSFD